MQAIEPPLVEAMARRFQRHMVDTLRLERPHRLVQRPRIRRRQAAIDMARGRIDA
ncbi:hypothetical protein D3C72_2598000 [compost metagenome]